jgi:hypothetical protein
MSHARPNGAARGARIEHGLRRTVQHEGRYLAEQAGLFWPGTAP